MRFHIHFLPRMRKSTLGLSMLPLALALLLLVGLAACTPTGGAAAPTSTAAPERCGSVSIAAGGRITNDTAAQAENCFWQAFSHCKPASLVVSTIGVDSGVTRTFTINPYGSGCTISDQAQTFTVPNHTGPLQTYTCAGLTQQSGGLLFQSCGNDGDILVPAPTK